MDLKGIMLSEVSQTEKDKYCMFSLICGVLIFSQIQRTVWWLSEVGVGGGLNG